MNTRRLGIVVVIVGVMGLVAEGGYLGYKKVAYMRTKSDVSTYIKDKSFANATDVDPVFKQSVSDTPLPNNAQGRAQYNQDLALIRKKVDLLGQQVSD